MVLQNITDYCKSRSLYYCFLAMAALVMAMQVFALPNMSRTKVDILNSGAVQKFLPYMQDKPGPGATGFTYSLSLYYSNVSFQQTEYQIVPGGCVRRITVNNRNVPFHSDNICDPRPASYWIPYSTPVYIDLARYLKDGRNTVQIQTIKSEFNIGPVILYDSTRLSKWIGLCMAAAVCIALILIVERQTGERLSGYIISGGFLVYLSRFSQTSVSQYSMDLPGHLYYITYIADQWQVPKPYWGYSFYHPPLYYALEALVLHFSNWFRSFDVVSCLQLFSLCCFITFIVCAALTLHRLIRIRLAYYTALIFLVFYPSGIMFAARLDSNLLFYACYSACLYFVVCWLQENKNRDFGLALAMLGLALATRANALILLPLMLLSCLYYWLKLGWPASIAHATVVRAGLIIVCLGIAAGIGRIEYYHITESRHEPFLVGNINVLSRALILNESLDTLLLPNIPLYIQHPLWNVWNDVNGRQYFWNSMIKSSFTGEYNWDSLDAKELAGAMGNIMLAIIIYIMDAYLLHRRVLRSSPEWWLCLVSLMIPIGALMEHRWLYPFACSEDFRYIYPAIASFCGLFGLSIERHLSEWRPFRTWLGVGLCLAFAFCSVRFYML